MTCKQMGGPCEEKIHGTTPDEMMENGTKHLEEKHPEMAADMKKMAKDDPKMVEWQEKFNMDWEKTPDDGEDEEM